MRVAPWSQRAAPSEVASAASIRGFSSPSGLSRDGVGENHHDKQCDRLVAFVLHHAGCGQNRVRSIAAILHRLVQRLYLPRSCHRLGCLE